MADLTDAEYKLYSFPFSLYSMMARHTIQLGSATPNAKPPRKIALVSVDHRQNQNIEEDFLINVNPKGQVPVLVGGLLEQPLAESRAVSLYLAEKHYPAMLPVEHATVIKHLLERIHGVYGLSISNKNPTAEMTQHNRSSPVEHLLKRTDISPEYRNALERKLKFHNENNGVAFQPAVVTKAHEDLQAVFTEIIELRKHNNTSSTNAEWIFGSQMGPTVLDSHLLPIVLRCIDAGNAELVPQELQHWAGIMAKSIGWKKVMHGRATQYNPSMGPISDMTDMMSL